MCNHVWEPVYASGYNQHDNEKTYKCEKCGQIISSTDIVEGVMKKIRALKDGESGSIEEMLRPDEFDYAELPRISFLVVLAARNEGIWLEIDNNIKATVRYNDVFKKYKKKNIEIRRIGKKDGQIYKYGSSLIEHIEMRIAESTHASLSLTFCCDEQTQTQHTESSSVDYVMSREYIVAISEWVKALDASNPQYDMSNKIIICPEHYGKVIVSVNGISYLLDSHSKLLKEIETYVDIKPLRAKVEKARDKFVGKGSVDEKWTDKLKGSILKLFSKS
jgi:hypothetical protein